MNPAGERYRKETHCRHGLSPELGLAQQRISAKLEHGEVP
jgi:hypothetical protein